MRYIFKSSLLAAVLLLFCSTLPAQRFVTGGMNSPFGNGWGYGGYGGYGYANYGWGWNGFGDSGGYDFYVHHPEEHPPFGVGFAHGDPDFVPSTYMDYNSALELGKKILAEQAAPQPSLGEIARQLRLRKRSYVPPPAPRSSANPARKADSFVILEDSHGTLMLCRVNTNCRAASSSMISNQS